MLLYSCAICRFQASCHRGHRIFARRRTETGRALSCAKLSVDPPALVESRRRPCDSSPYFVSHLCPGVLLLLRPSVAGLACCKRSHEGSIVTPVQHRDDAAATSSALAIATAVAHLDTCSFDRYIHDYIVLQRSVLRLRPFSKPGPRYCDFCSSCRQQVSQTKYHKLHHTVAQSLWCCINPQQRGSSFHLSPATRSQFSKLAGNIAYTYM